MPAAAEVTTSRLDRRKARTRASLVRLPVRCSPRATGGHQHPGDHRAADVGFGSFYNHFTASRAVRRRGRGGPRRARRDGRRDDGRHRRPSRGVRGRRTHDRAPAEDAAPAGQDLPPHRLRPGRGSARALPAGAAGPAGRPGDRTVHRRRRGRSRSPASPAPCSGCCTWHRSTARPPPSTELPTSSQPTCCACWASPRTRPPASRTASCRKQSDAAISLDHIDRAYR